MIRIPNLFKKAYPAYFDTYEEIDTLIHWLNGIDNLYCVGRNGQHRYNNIDHSMCTSFEVVHNIVNGIRDPLQHLERQYRKRISRSEN